MKKYINNKKIWVGKYKHKYLWLIAFEYLGKILAQASPQSLNLDRRGWQEESKINKSNESKRKQREVRSSCYPVA